MNPKKKSKELKRISRENLNGRYRLSMSVFLTVTLINLFSDLPFLEAGLCCHRHCSG